MKIQSIGVISGILFFVLLVTAVAVKTEQKETSPVVKQPVSKEEFVPVKFDVYELFKIEDEKEFEARLKSIPEPYQWMSVELIRKRRSEYQREFKRFKEKYSVCDNYKPGSPLPAVYGDIGDKNLVNYYGYCRRLAGGTEACSVLKKNFKSSYGDCADPRKDFWFEVMPFITRKSVTDKQIKEFSRKLCVNNVKMGLIKGKKNIAACPGKITMELKALRPVLYYKSAAKCASLKDKKGRELCESIFRKDESFCKKHPDEFAMSCMEGRHRFVSAMATGDRSVFETKDISTNNVLASYYIDKNYCADFYREKLVPACRALEKSAIDGIRVVFP